MQAFTMMRAALSIAVCALAAGATGSAATPRSVTLDDLLRMEDIGQAAVADNERSLVYEWIAPYEDAPNLEMPIELGDPGPHAKLYTVDLGRPGSPRLLFPQEPAGGYWIGALSPDATRLAVYSLVSRRFRAGVFDFASGSLRWFDFTPNYYPSHMQHPTWISNDELVYSVLPPGTRPAVMGRYAMTARMTDLWEKSFRGKEPSVTVHVSARSGIEDPDLFEPGTLVRVDARTGRSAVIDAGYHMSLRLSPDGRYLAALRFGGQLRASDPRLAGFTKHLQPVIFDLQAGSAKATPCEDCHVMPSNLWWSADGARLAFRTFHTRTEQLEILQYRPATRRLSSVDDGGLWLSCWIPVLPAGPGDEVAVFAQPLADRKQKGPWIPTCSREARQDWFLAGGHADPRNLTASVRDVGEGPVGLTPEGPLIVTDGGAAWVLSATGRTRKLELAKSIDAPVQRWEMFSMEASRAGTEFPTRHVVMQTPKHVVYYDLQTLHGSSVRRPSADSNLLAMAAHTAVFRENLPDGGSRLRVAAARGPVRDVLSFNGHLQGIRLGSQVRIPFEYKGEKLSGCALLPPDWKPQHRYPVIVDVYPGVGEHPPCYASDLANAYSTQLFAAHGYIVLYPPTASHLIRTAEGPTRGLTAVVVAAVDAAIAQGYADPERLGLYGMSQGFHSALQVITESSRFKAAVAANGIADFASHYGLVSPETLSQPYGGSPISNIFSNADRYEAAGGDNGLGTPPWVDVQRYTSNSPIFHADRIDTPVLLLYGDLDAFGKEQATEMFSVLYRLHKEAQYAIYWGESHGNASPANIRDVWRRMLEWYGEHFTAPSAAARPRR